MQQPVYYCSQALRGAEERYPKMEKLILALVNSSRKLRPYFQAHTVEVPTEYPMKKILHKLETSGRLIKWAIELSEFDIRYKSRTAVKGQILADFIMEFTPIESTEATQLTPDLLIWRLSVDTRQCSRKRCRSDPDLSRRDRCGIRPQIRLPTLK